MRSFLLALPLLLAAGGFASAEGLDDCGGSTVEMTKCVWDHYQAVDEELNDVWKQALGVVASNGDLPADKVQEWKDHLIAAEKAWIAFKEEDCNGAVAYEWYGGTGANAAVGTCLYAHTTARISELKDRYLNR